MAPDEIEVVSAAGRGDRDAWEVLYRRLYPRLRSYLARKVGETDAEDAVSETMARAVKGIGGYTPGPAGFDGWVFGIARRVAADHHRKAGRVRRQDMAAARFVPTTDNGATPGEDLVAGDDRAELRRAFVKLSPQDQEILELRVVADLSADQVAVVLETAPGAVRTAQSRALSRLRRLLEAESA